MQNKIIIGLFVLLLGCKSTDERITDSNVVDSSTVKSTSNTETSIKNSEGAINNSGEVKKIDEHLFITNIFDFKKQTEWTFIGKRPVIVDFYADWCGPCKKLSPVIEHLAKKYAGKIDFYKVNIDEEQAIAQVFGIQSIPTIMFCGMKGKPMASMGLVEEAELEKYIAQIMK